MGRHHGLAPNGLIYAFGPMTFAIVCAVTILVGFIALLSVLGQRPRTTPEELLATRFAKGEIDEAEYARRLAILRYGPPLELPD